MAWQDSVNTWLAANPNATSVEKQGAAQLAGGAYDASTGSFKYDGYTYNPTTNTTSERFIPSLGFKTVSDLTAPGGLLSTATNKAPQQATATAQTTPLTQPPPAAQTPYTTNGDLAAASSWNTSAANKYVSQYGDYDKSSKANETWLAEQSDIDNYYTSSEFNDPAKWDAIDPGLRKFYTKLPDQVVPVASGTQYKSNFNSQVDGKSETIEGRIQNLLAANNPVIQQAGEAAMAQFAQRGLANSSMAVQAAQEAMVSKAIEIAGPDAQTYFQNRTNNVNWQNKFAQAEQQQGYDLQKLDYANNLQQDTTDKNQSINLQNNYQSAIQNIDTQYKNQMTTLQNNTAMDPAAKTAALDDLVTVRNNSIRLMTQTFQQFPQWSEDWSGLVQYL